MIRTVTDFFELTFQMVKICCHHFLIRYFRFRKYLVLYCYFAQIQYRTCNKFWPSYTCKLLRIRDIEILKRYLKLKWMPYNRNGTTFCIYKHSAQWNINSNNGIFMGYLHDQNMIWYEAKGVVHFKFWYRDINVDAITQIQ